MMDGGNALEKLKVIKGFKGFLYEFLGVRSLIEVLKRESNQSKETCQRLKKSIDDLNKEVDELKKLNHQLVSEKFDIHNDNIFIDFANPEVCVFSVERIWDDEWKLPRTVIAYKDNEGKMEEWFFNITEEKHKAIILEFQNSITTKRMKGK